MSKTFLRTPKAKFLVSSTYLRILFGVILGRYKLGKSHVIINLKNMLYYGRQYCVSCSRLIPTLLAVIALEATWLVHAGKGPNWHYINIRIRNNCRANAWINLLFLSNVINVEKMVCLSKS